jgi:hypothetical protein
MPDRHPTEEELILHYYGEGDPAGDLEQHIMVCERCRMALDELRAVLSLIDAQPLPEPLVGLEQRVWTRLKPAIEAERSRSWWRLFGGAPGWALAAGVAMIVIAAFVAGRASRPNLVSPAVPIVADADRSDSAVRLMDVAVGDHLDESQMMLLELLNGDASAATLGNEQARARDLVAANRLYRETALRSGDQRVGEILDALERVLIEIANAPPDVSARELEALRADIEQRGILFRLRVVASEMRAREQKGVTGPLHTGP